MCTSGYGDSAADTIVIGVGNTFLGDDGVGYCLARAIISCSPPVEARIEAVQTLTPGHVDLLAGARLAILVDAYHGSKSSIVVLELDPGRLDPLDAIFVSESIDPHSLNPLQLIALAHSAGLFNGRGVLVGIRPKRLVFGEGLSMEVVERALDALEVVKGVLKRRAGVELRASKSCVKEWLIDNCRGPLLD